MATKTKAQRASFIYGLVFGLYTVFVGALFVWQVWAIYFGAESKPFSVASISTHFGQIQWFVWVWLTGLIANVILGVIFPDEKKKSGYTDYDMLLKKMRARLPDDGKSALKMKPYSLIRKILWCAGGAVLVACIIVCAYFFSGAYIPHANSEFLTESNGVAERLLCIFSFVGGMVVVLAVAAVVDNFLAVKELSLVKRAVAEQARAKQNLENGTKKTNKEEPATQKKKELAVWITRGVLACAAVTLIIVGICNGGMMDVLQKAINICTQCIGLG